jgi:DNA-binding transcriptional MerR regulator
MLISEVVKITGLSKDTIRYYEKIGLIKVKRTTSDWNNYKDYSDHNVNTLLTIKKAKGFGFTLNEISEILFLLNTKTVTCSSLLDKTDQKLKEIDQKISELKFMKDMILKKVSAFQNQCNSSGNTNCDALSSEFKL